MRVDSKVLHTLVIACAEGALANEKLNQWKTAAMKDERNEIIMEMEKKDVQALKPDCLAPAAIEAKAETVAIGKTNLSTGRCFALSILAGMFIGMGALFMLFVKADSNLSFAPSQILGGLCFSLGLICVIVAGAELFTGNALMICAKVSGKISWGGLAKNWVLVWVGNFIGSLILVFIIVMCNSASFDSGAVGNAMINTAYSKINLPWMTIFFRGIMCNILVCLAVWMGFGGRTVIDKIFTSMIPVMAFVACGFEHCVANMFFLPMGVVTLNTVGYTGTTDIDKINAVVTAGGALFNISASTLGNIVGGALFIGGLYWIAYHKKQTNK